MFLPKVFINGLELSAFTEAHVFNYDSGFTVTLKYKEELNFMSRFYRRRQGTETTLHNVNEFRILIEEDLDGVADEWRFLFDSRFREQAYALEEEHIEAIESICITN